MSEEKQLELAPADGVPAKPPDPRAQAAEYLTDLARWLRDGSIKDRAARARAELQKTDPRGVAI